MMDADRAKQIMESHGVIEVLYNQTPIWLEQIKNNGTAEVTALDSNIRFDVPIAELNIGDPPTTY